MMGLHMEGHLIGATKMCEGFTWRLTGNMTKKVYKLHVECHKKFEWGAVLWIKIGGVKNVC